jgi:hypothetical protein
VLKRRRPKIELKHFHLTHQLILRKTKSRSYSRYLGFAKNFKHSLKLDTYRLSKLLRIRRAYCRKSVLNFILPQFDKDSK